MKKIVSFSGGKGGSGRTFIVSSLGILLAQKGHDVIVFDGATGSANLHTALGIKTPGATFSDFASGETNSFADVILDTPTENLRLISCAHDSLNPPELDYPAIKKLKKQLKNVECDFLLIDTCAGAGFNVIDLFMMADIGTLVITPEPSSIELVYRFIKTSIYRKLLNEVPNQKMVDIIDEEMTGGATGGLIETVRRILSRIGKIDDTVSERAQRSLEKFDLKLILNMAKDRHDQAVGPAVREITEKFYGIDLDYLGHIPYDERVTDFAKLRKPFVEHNTTSNTAACLELLAKALMESVETVPVDGQLDLITS